MLPLHSSLGSAPCAGIACGQAAPGEAASHSEHELTALFSKSSSFTDCVHVLNNYLDNSENALIAASYLRWNESAMRLNGASTSLPVAWQQHSRQGRLVLVLESSHAGQQDATDRNVPSSTQRSPARARPQTRAPPRSTPGQPHRRTAQSSGMTEATVTHGQLTSA